MATILVVDDDVLSREFLRVLLSYGGHCLLEASDGLLALNMARDQLPQLIITDILMPNMDGYEFVSRLRADNQISEIPVIFYTANYREREAGMMALACNVQRVLSKPSAPDVILTAVHEALGIPQALGQPPQLPHPPPEATRFSTIDNQVSEYLFELKLSSHLISQVANRGDKNLLEMSQRLTKSLTSLQAVSLRLTALIDLGIQLAAERDGVNLIEASCRVAQNICVAKYAAIGILNRDGDKLQHFVTWGLDGASQDMIGMPLPDNGVLGALLKSREPKRISGVGGAPQALGFEGNHPPIHSFLGVPIISRDRNYGWLYVVDKFGADEFTEIDERVAATITAQLAVAYENVVLVEELKRKHIHLETEMSARMRSDVELRRFRLAMDASADAIFLLDRAVTRLIDVNDTACRLLGYTRDEFLTIDPGDASTGSNEHFEQLYDQVFACRGDGGCSEAELRCKDGSSLPVEIVQRVLQSGNSWIMLAIARDITERKKTEERLLQLAHYDPLTGLPNRMFFYNSLVNALKQAEEHHWQVAVLFIDLDRFKNVNDTLGHPIGDELLRQFARRVLSCVRVRDTVGRIGGDEFALILTMPESQHTAVLVAQNIQKVLRTPFDLNGHEVTVAASIGITIYPNDASDPETLMKYADTAMYQGKEAGRDTYRFFTLKMNAQAKNRLDLENALRKALDNYEFRMYYQPQVSLSTGRIIGAEALIRWQRPGHGLVSPIGFIPILEDTGLIVRVGTWVINTVCRQIGTWMRVLSRPIHVAVNVSGKQFFDTHLESDVVSALEKYSIPPELLGIELTESSLMADAAQAKVLLENLKKLGVAISIDDFGTGYSSLAYLRRFPIDKLKIDIAFIRDVTTNPDDAAITQAIIQMAHSLKLSVIAEGVETKAQLDYLRTHQCDEIQGYYFSCPIPPEEFEQMIMIEKNLPAISENSQAEPKP